MVHTQLSYDSFDRARMRMVILNHTGLRCMSTNSSPGGGEKGILLKDWVLNG